MPTRRIRFGRQAGLEFLEVLAWYAKESPAIAEAFNVTLNTGLERILESPLRWPLHLAGTRRYRLTRFPFSVIYLVEENTVDVVAVAHDSRKPGYWVDRL